MNHELSPEACETASPVQGAAETEGGDGVWWYSSPPGPLGHLHCVLASMARAVSWDDLGLSLPLYKSSELGRPGTP